MRRVNVRGSSCSGKTTTGRLLADILGVPLVELDGLNHGPNWTEATADDLRSRAQAAMDAATDGWVIDGGYRSKLGDLVLQRADTLVWLDLPLQVCLRRLWRRTWRRIIRHEELWSGNRESIRSAFLNKDSLFLWTAKRHRPGRRLLLDRIAANPHLLVIRLRSPHEVEQWLERTASELSGPSDATDRRTRTGR